MKNIKKIRESSRYCRVGALKFSGMLVLLVAMSGSCARADEVRFAPSYSERESADAVDVEVRKAVGNVEKRLKDVESSLEVVEARLGRAVRPPTLSSNLERRLLEVERRLTAIERDLKQVDTLARDMKRMEDRLRRVETRK